MDFVWFLVTGLAAGWLASQVMKGGPPHETPAQTVYLGRPLSL